jgi:hypothetical protein
LTADFELDVEPTAEDFHSFVVAVREMMDAQDAAKVPGPNISKRQVARCHEQHVRQWIRGLLAELNSEPERSAA